MLVKFGYKFKAVSHVSAFD